LAPLNDLIGHRPLLEGTDPCSTAIDRKRDETPWLLHRNSGPVSDVVTGCVRLHRWELDLTQISVHHIARVLQAILPYTSSGVARVPGMLWSPLAFATR